MIKTDIAIIGSGLGSLICAYILGKEGYQVTIIEKNKQIGGCLQVFRRDGVVFDTGAHYVGGLDEGQNLYRFFKYFGLTGKLKLRRMNENAFDIISFGDDEQEYHYANGYERFAESLCGKFPHERAAIQTYCSKLREISSNFPLYNLREDNKAFMEQEYFQISASDYISSITSNERLQAVLAGTNLLYAGVKDKTPLYIHSLINSTYIESAYRFVDGAAQAANLLAESIKSQGGRIIRSQTAKKFKFENNLLKSLETAEGELIEGKYFISGIHPAATLEMIEPDKIRRSYRSRINDLENTISIFTSYITLKKKSFKYLNSNYYCYRGNNVWTTDTYNKSIWPESYMLLTPASSKSAEFAEGITAMSYMKYDEVKKWEGSQVENRGAGYEEFKQEKAERQLEFIGQRFSGLKGCISSVYTSTPLTYKDYIGTREGSLYGILRDCNDPLKSIISPKTKIPNLFLTGQNINLHGALGVTIGAILTCAEFTGISYLLKKIKESL